MVYVPEAPPELPPERVAELLERTKRRGLRQHWLRTATTMLGAAVLLAAVLVPVALLSAGPGTAPVSGNDAAHHQGSYPLQKVQWNKVAYPDYPSCKRKRFLVGGVSYLTSPRPLAVVLARCQGKLSSSQGAVYVFDGAAGRTQPTLLQVLVRPSVGVYQPIELSVMSVTHVITVPEHAYSGTQRGAQRYLYFDFRDGRYRLRQILDVLARVPNMVGEPVGTAKTTLIGMGLRYSLHWVRISEAPGGHVLAQSPPAGTELMTGSRGSRVTLDVGF
jgi:hypothetical protein